MNSFSIRGATCWHNTCDAREKGRCSTQSALSLAKELVLLTLSS